MNEVQQVMRNVDVTKQTEVRMNDSRRLKVIAVRSRTGRQVAERELAELPDDLAQAVRDRELTIAKARAFTKLRAAFVGREEELEDIFDDILGVKTVA